MTQTIEQVGNSLSPDLKIVLVDIELSGINGSYTDINITNSSNGSTPIMWRGTSYYPFPFEIKGGGLVGDGSAPERATLGISLEGDVGKYIRSAIKSIGSVKGAIVRRWTTFYQFTDNGDNPNPIMHYPVETWQIIEESPEYPVASFTLAGPMDRPNTRLPRKLILRDPVGNDIYFPGVGRVRAR